MISFAALSALMRAFFALWALLLCLTDIGSAVLATVRKRSFFAVIAMLLLLPCYFIWQVIFDYSLLAGTGGIMPVSTALCELPVVYWTAVFVLLTAAAALLLAFNIRYDRRYITPGAIKLYLDKVPCGICCWRENGRVLFSNICINALCVAVTGHPLLNGNQFRDAVKDGILNIDGKVWRFARREIVIDGEKLSEIIASDITAEYAKTETLEKDKTELSRLNSELWEYYLSIDDSVQQQEILQAKINIHDEMNRLMLSTVAADINDTETLDKIFSLWEQNALLMCMEAGGKEGGSRRDAINSLAEALGIELIWRGELPDTLTDKQKELLYSTAQEATINAVKHAQAKKVEIIVEGIPELLTCRFSNNGKMPEGEVRFEGGLANIALLAEKQGATLSVDVTDNFSLILTINHTFG